MQLQKQKESQKLVIKYLRDSINSLIKKKIIIIIRYLTNLALLLLSLETSVKTYKPASLLDAKWQRCVSQIHYSPFNASAKFIITQSIYRF